ncbi:Maf family protein [Ignavibacteria bacterium]|jgi:septum formation protein|nr:septum formation inhibitor Maf [Bacteroidota bacterium]MCZ2131644.1 Maf family protein [Bacteroidota bacterium]
MLTFSRSVVLASQSPRRRALLKQIGIDFSVQVSDINEEEMSLDMPPTEYAAGLALRKAEAVACKQDTAALVIGADTIVVLDGAILNKPADSAEAQAMLRRLSGRTHTVYTGVAVVHAPELTAHCETQKTEVTFRELDDKEILEYVATGSPLDKAGSYGIQDDFGAVFVRNIIGCYYNIVGLPLELLYRMLRKVAL